jgi:hypothetical protein
MKQIIYDKDDKPLEIAAACFKGSVIYAYTVEGRNPVACEVILDSGEVVGAIRDNDFRGAKGIDSLFLEVTKDAVFKGVLPLESGSLFGNVDPNNEAANKLWQRIGCRMEVIKDENGKEWNRYYFHVVDFVTSGNKGK